jgi:hypothetical protein
VLDRVFPEYETVFTNVFIASSQRLLQEAVAAQELAEFDLNELSSLLHRTSRGRLGLVQAQAVQHAVQSSVGVWFLSDAARLEMRCLLE